MSKVQCPECLRELVDSEIFGEAVSLALLNVAKSDRDRYHFATLLQLETETKARPAEDSEILRSMIRHESAILRWFEMESLGETRGSLDAIIDELEYPLPT